MRCGSDAHARSAAAAASPRHARSTAGSGDGEGTGTGDHDADAAAAAAIGVAAGVGVGVYCAGKGVRVAAPPSCSSSMAGLRAGVGVGDPAPLAPRAAGEAHESAVDGVCGSQNSERAGTTGVPLAAAAGDGATGTPLRLSSSCALLSAASGVRGGAWAAHAAAAAAHALPGTASARFADGGGGVSHRGGSGGGVRCCCCCCELGVHVCRRGDGDGRGVGEGGGATAARSTHAAAAASVAAREAAREASAARKRASVSADGGVVAGEAALPGVAGDAVSRRKDAALAPAHGRSAVPPRAGLRQGCALAPGGGAGERPRGGRADVGVGVGVAPRLGDASTPCGPPPLLRRVGCAHGGETVRSVSVAAFSGLLAGAPARRTPGLADRSGVRPLGVAHIAAATHARVVLSA
jgi:hypothetical protein